MEIDQDNPRVSEAGEQLLDDFHLLRDSLAQRSQELRDRGAELVREHPFAAVGVAFGVGWLLSGALYSRMTGRFLKWGLRFAAGAFVRQALAGGALDALASQVSGRRPAPSPVPEE